jgi:hypothetical protein
VYLEGSKFPVQILTDHKNLIYFTTTKELNRRQVRWAETLATYNFTISYVKGTENARADALSRKPEYMRNSQPVSHAILRQDGDSLVRNDMQLATTNDDATSEGKLWIPPEQRKQFVRDQHSLPAHGHQGVSKTLARLKRKYCFPGMRSIVKTVVSECECQRNKSARHAPYGLLKSPHTPAKAWSSIAWDFVVKLPLSKEPVTMIEYDSIFVITDRLTKYAYMIPYKETCTAEDLAYTFLRTVFANHGLPDEIISDRDKLFTSKFWTTFTALLGTKLKLSTAFHPQTDGQTERLNQTMETYLRSYVNYRQDNWAELLPLAQFAYNSADTDSTKVSPFFANYGFNPEAYRTSLSSAHQSAEATVRAEELKALHQQLASDIRFYAERSASYYNEGRSVGPTLKEGDKVYLLRKNIQTKRPSSKLDHKKLGPFKIQKVVGPVNFRLTLPRTMNIHPVFHISLLESAPPGAAPAPITEIQPVNPNAEYEVETILHCKYVSNKVKYFIRWKDYPPSEDSWEPKSCLRNCPEKLAAFHRQYPGLPKKQPPRPDPAGSRGTRSRQ